MMLYEFPKLVHHFSLERVGMQIDYQILDEKKALSQEMLKLCARLDRKLDVQPDGVGGFWINRIDYRGIRIDEMRLARYKAAKEGSFSGTYQQQQELYEATAGICHVTQHKTDQGQQCWIGDCIDCWKSLICPCAVFIHYKEQIDYFANPIGGSCKQGQQAHSLIIPKIRHVDPEQSGFDLPVNGVCGKPTAPPKTMKNALIPLSQTQEVESESDNNMKVSGSSQKKKTKQN